MEHPCRPGPPAMTGAEPRGLAPGLTTDPRLRVGRGNSQHTPPSAPPTTSGSVLVQSHATAAWATLRSRRLLQQVRSQGLVLVSVGVADGQGLSNDIGM